MRTMKLLAAMVTLCTAGIASAQDDGGDRVGDVNVFLRAGLADYTGDFGSSTDTGPIWGLAVNLQPFQALGFELGYDGNRNAFAGGGLTGDAALMRHSVSGLLKLSLPIGESIRPFIGGGVGVSYLDVTGALIETDGDFLQEVPLVAGIEFNTGHLTAGVRATYRYMFNADINDGDADANKVGGLLDASVTLGARF